MKVKPAWIALILLGMYIVSIFALSLLQRVSSPMQLPSDVIISYRIDPQVKYSLIQAGITVLTFEYSSTCDNCYNQKFFLESMVTDFKQQVYKDAYNIYLAEILNETFDSSKLTIESKLGNQTFINPTQNETFNATCRLMVFQPIVCAIK